MQELSRILNKMAGITPIENPITGRNKPARSAPIPDATRTHDDPLGTIDLKADENATYELPSAIPAAPAPVDFLAQPPEPRSINWKLWLPVGIGVALLLLLCTGGGIAWAVSSGLFDRQYAATPIVHAPTDTPSGGGYQPPPHTPPGSRRGRRLPAPHRSAIGRRLPAAHRYSPPTPQRHARASCLRVQPAGYGPHP
jgi:hypothetical protein